MGPPLPAIPRLIVVIILLCIASFYYLQFAAAPPPRPAGPLTRAVVPQPNLGQLLSPAPPPPPPPPQAAWSINDGADYQQRQQQQREEERFEDEEEEDDFELNQESRRLRPSEFYFPLDRTLSPPRPLDPFPRSADMIASVKWFVEKAEHNSGGMVDSNLAMSPFGRKAVLGQLMLAFDDYMHAEGLVFWLAHGTLMGQKWGQAVMTHDPDIDVQVTLETMSKLSRIPPSPRRSRYSLGINPHWMIRHSKGAAGGEENVIDARFVDEATGVYVDITALSAISQDDPLAYHSYSSKIDEIIHDKSIHDYNISWISPLAACPFEGRIMWCPNLRDRLLEEEYQYTLNARTKGWKYDAEIGVHVPLRCDALLAMFTAPTADTCDSECRFVIGHPRSMRWVPQERKTDCVLQVRLGTKGDGAVRTYTGVKGKRDRTPSLSNRIWPACINFMCPR